MNRARFRLDAVGCRLRRRTGTGAVWENEAGQAGKDFYGQERLDKVVDLAGGEGIHVGLDDRRVSARSARRWAPAESGRLRQGLGEHPDAFTQQVDAAWISVGLRTSARSSWQGIRW
jgi:hypothetical protein